MSDLMDSVIENCRLQNITQRELAKKSGITETSISRYFNGERNPNIKNAEKMASALGLSIVMINESILESDCANSVETNRTDDVCEWTSTRDGEFIQNPHTKRLYSNEPSMKNVYCNTCEKKIKVVE